MQEIEQCWRGMSWFDVMILPSLTWVKPFLSHCKLPDALLENLPAWSEAINRVHDQYAVEQYEAREKCLLSLGIDLTSDYMPPRTEHSFNVLSDFDARYSRSYVTQGFYALAEIIGEPEARKFEHWCRIHFFLNQGSFGFALGVWWSVLRRAWIYVRPEVLASLIPRKQKRHLAPPDALVPLLPEMAHWIDLQTVRDMDARVEAAAPLEKNPDWNVRFIQESRAERDQKRLSKASPEQRLKIEEEIRNRPPIPEYVQPHSAYLLKQVIEQVLRFNFLQIMAHNLQPTEIAEVLDWAERQIDKCHTYNPDFPDFAKRDKELLRGDYYISGNLPDFDGVSVFDLPASIHELPFHN